MKVGAKIAMTNLWLSIVAFTVHIIEVSNISWMVGIFIALTVVGAMVALLHESKLDPVEANDE